MNLKGVKLNERYVIERELDEPGGLGMVYLAEDTRVGSRPVVIKTMLEEQGSTFDAPWHQEKFKKEIDALVRVNHQGVVGIFDVGQLPDGKPFFVMPYIEGENLRKAMLGGVMELQRAARIILQLAFALSAAHAEGVTHRDIKPENVMLKTFKSGEEVTIIIDFGLATVIDIQSGQSKQKTKVAGTVPYMAPEQLRGEPSYRSDIWSLGVVAYELVTGDKPFPSGNNHVELDEMQRAGLRIMPKTLRPELPAAAQQVILRALAYAPTDRYPSAHEMGEAFFRAIPEKKAPMVPSPDAAQGAQSLMDTPVLPVNPGYRVGSYSRSPRGELLLRCQKLFEEFDEFHDPYRLRVYLNVRELKACLNCLAKSSNLDIDHLIACLSGSGRDYRGQALVELLEALTDTYQHDVKGQECKELSDRLHQLLKAGVSGT